MEIELLTTVEDLAAVRDEWESLEERAPDTTFYVRHRFVSAWSAAYADVAGHELQTLLLRNNGRLVAVAPLAVRAVRKQGRTRRVLRFASQGDYLAVLVDPDAKVDTVGRRLMDHVRDELDWDSLSLTNIPVTSAFAHFLLRSEDNPAFTLHVENPYIDLTRFADFEDYSARDLPSRSRKWRNKLLRETGATFRVVEGGDDGIFDRIAALHRREKEFLADERGRTERRSLYEDPRRVAYYRPMFEDGRDAVTFAYESEDGELLGYRTCFRDGRRLLSWNSAYAPELEHLRVGKALQYDILAHLFETRSADVFDFGAGRYPWKFEWTADFTATYRLQIQRSTPEPAREVATSEAGKREQSAPPVSRATSRARQVLRRLGAGAVRRRARSVSNTVRRAVSRPVVWYVPHPDDETIFMGGSIAGLRDRRHLLVVLTRGGASGALPPINDKLSEPLGIADMMDARRAEFMAATEALGIRSQDITFHDLPDGGLEVSDVREVVKDVARRHPSASHRTMSFTDPHRDHRAAGEALRSLHAEGAVSDVVFHLPVPVVDASLGSPARLSEPAKKAKRRALRAYQVWEPAAGRYAVGWHSVRSLVTFQLKTPTERVHGPDYTEGT